VKKDLNDVQLSKQKVRELMLRQRLDLREDIRRKLSEEVWSRLNSRIEIRSSAHLGLFFPFQGEVDISPHFQELWSEGKKLHFPRLNSEGARLEFVSVAAAGPWIQGKWGIREPSPELPSEDLALLDVLILPGVAFDLRGNRLGFGKGFYDRLLKDYRGRTLALAYDFQVNEEIPTESHDRKIDVLVTESRVLVFD